MWKEKKVDEFGPRASKRSQQKFLTFVLLTSIVHQRCVKHVHVDIFTRNRDESEGGQ